MIKAVVFDLDDTLISENLYIESGYRHISKILCKELNRPENELFSLLKNLYNVNSKNVFNRLLDNFGIDFTKSDILDLVEEYRNHTPEITFYNDVIPCLNELKNKGLKLGIITDGYANSQRRKLMAIKAEDFFDEIIVTDELGEKYWKPHPLAFEKMREKLGVDYSNMVYVGDNFSKDFVTPNRVGMKSVFIDRENKVYNKNRDLYELEFQAKYSIEKLNQLVEILQIKGI